jgi:hypothetical protein
MARTTRGNLTGRASWLEKQNQIEADRERRKEFSNRFMDAFSRLKLIDPGWEKWFDEQPEQTCGEMLPLMEERIRILDEDLLSKDEAQTKEMNYPR